jgi:hypothetical protein
MNQSYFESYLSTFFNLTLPMSFKTSVMEGTDMARDFLSILSVAFKLFDCNDSAKDNFLLGVSLAVPLIGRGGGGGGGKRPVDIGGGGGGGGPKSMEAGGGGGGGGIKGGGGGIGVAGMLP